MVGDTLGDGVGLGVGEGVGDGGGDGVGDAVVGDTVVGTSVVGDVLGERLGATLGDLLGAMLGDSVHGRRVHTGRTLCLQPSPLQLRSHIASPAAMHNSSACAKVYGRAGSPPMQPLSSLLPTQRRQPARLLSKGSQH